MSNEAQSELYAEKNVYGWSVIDPDGGRWWPDADAALEIESSDVPAETAVRMCHKTPTRGEWHA